MATLTTSWQKLGEKFLGTSGGSLYVRIYARYSQQDIANNRTYVYYQSRAYYSGGYIMDAQASGNVSGTGLSTKTNNDVPDRLNGGETTIATTEGWVYHNNDGKKSITANGYLNYPNWGWSATASGSADLPTIPRKANIQGGKNFTDEDYAEMTYSNPAGNNVSSLQGCIAIGGNLNVADIPYRDIPKTGNKYTFNFTEEERKILRQKCTGTSCVARYHIKTVIGGNTFYSTVDRTLTIINANPVFTDFEWQTTNYNNLTGDNQTVIKGYSNIKTIVSEENKATGLKEATLTSYQTTIGSKSVTNNNIAYPVENVIQKVDGASITVFANDSRGNSTPIIKPISNYIEYKKIIGSISNLERTQQVNSEVNLQVEGEIDLVNFGAIVNSVVSAKYYYKEASSNDDFVEGTTKLNATLTQIEGTKYKYEIDQNIAGNLGANGFDINKSFLIKIVINDELDLVEDTETLGTGSPAIAVKGNCVSLGAPYNESIGGRVQINGDLYEGGSSTEIYSTEEKRIGTWIDKKPLYGIFLSTKTGTSIDTWTTIYNGNIERLTKFYYCFYKTSDNDSYPYSSELFLYVANGILREKHSKAWANNDELLIYIEYTKTTD